MSAERTWNVVKNALLVTIVSLLIWVWAEGESLRSLVTTPEVVIQSESPDRVVRVKGPGGAAWGGRSNGPGREQRGADPDETGGGRVRLRLEGSTLAIERAERLLSRPLVLTTGRGGVPGTPGESAVSLLDAIRQHPELSKLGVTVVDAEPGMVTIEVTSMVARDLPVRVIVTGVDLAGPPTVAPLTTRVTIPEALANLLPEGAFATAEISAGVVSMTDVRPQTIRGVPIVLPEPIRGTVGTGSVGATGGVGKVEPEKVDVTVQLRQREGTLTLPAVPVWVALPPTQPGDPGWEFVVEPGFLPSVVVSGPLELIDLMRGEARQVTAIAFVMLSTDDLERGQVEKDAVVVPVPSSLIGTGAGASAPVTGVPGNGEPGGADGVVRDAPPISRERLAPLRFQADDTKVRVTIRRRPADSATVVPQGTSTDP